MLNGNPSVLLTIFRGAPVPVPDRPFVYGVDPLRPVHQAQVAHLEREIQQIALLCWPRHTPLTDRFRFRAE